MNKYALALFALLAIGCQEADPSDKLQGTWINLTNDGCALGLTFDGGNMVLQTICTLTTGEPGDEIAGGTFTATDTNIVMTPHRTSCPANFPGLVSLGYFWANNGNAIGINRPTGALIFNRETSTGGASGSIRWGCWDDARENFTFGPLVDL